MDNYQNVKKITDNISNLMNSEKEEKLSSQIKDGLKEIEIDFKLSDEQVKITNDTNFSLHYILESSKIIRTNILSLFP